MYTTQPEVDELEIETPDNVTLLPVQKVVQKVKDRLDLTIEDLQNGLACGVLSKSAYIYFILRMRFDGSTNVDLKSLSDALTCVISVDDGKLKTFEFSEDEVLTELAKLNQKGALSIKQSAVQLRLNL